MRRTMAIQHDDESTQISNPRSVNNLSSSFNYTNSRHISMHQKTVEGIASIKHDEPLNNHAMMRNILSIED